MSILDDILEAKAARVEHAKHYVSVEELERRARAIGEPRPFARALAGARAIWGRPAVIAEIKKASPSAGDLRTDLDVAEAARAYVGAGATAISVLTEEDYFRGSLADLVAVRKATMLPLLRKDFVFDPYQVLEARSAGADAVLLIVRALSDACLRELVGLAAELGLDALVEVHDEDDLARALDTGASFIGANNRDLAGLEVDLGVAERLLPMVPKGIVKVAASGVGDRSAFERMAEAGADAVLSGEALMTQDDVAAALAALTGQGRQRSPRGAVMD